MVRPRAGCHRRIQGIRRIAPVQLFRRLFLDHQRVVLDLAVGRSARRPQVALRAIAEPRKPSPGANGRHAECQAVRPGDKNNILEDLLRNTPPAVAVEVDPRIQKGRRPCPAGGAGRDHVDVRHSTAVDWSGDLHAVFIRWEPHRIHVIAQRLRVGLTVGLGVHQPSQVQAGPDHMVGARADCQRGEGRVGRVAPIQLFNRLPFDDHLVVLHLAVTGAPRRGQCARRVDPEAGKCLPDDRTGRRRHGDGVRAGRQHAADHAFGGRPGPVAVEVDPAVHPTTDAARATDRYANTARLPLEQHRDSHPVLVVVAVVVIVTQRVRVLLTVHLGVRHIRSVTQPRSTDHVVRPRAEGHGRILRVRRVAPVQLFSRLPFDDHLMVLHLAVTGAPRRGQCARRVDPEAGKCLPDDRTGRRRHGDGVRAGRQHAADHAFGGRPGPVAVEVDPAVHPTTDAARATDRYANTARLPLEQHRDSHPVLVVVAVVVIVTQRVRVLLTVHLGIGHIRSVTQPRSADHVVGSRAGGHGRIGRIRRITPVQLIPAPSLDQYRVVLHLPVGHVPVVADPPLRTDAEAGIGCPGRRGHGYGAGQRQHAPRGDPHVLKHVLIEAEPRAIAVVVDPCVQNAVCRGERPVDHDGEIQSGDKRGHEHDSVLVGHPVVVIAVGCCRRLAVRLDVDELPQERRAVHDRVAGAHAGGQGGVAVRRVPPVVLLLHERQPVVVVSDTGPTFRQRNVGRSDTAVAAEEVKTGAAGRFPPQRIDGVFADRQRDGADRAAVSGPLVESDLVLLDVGVPRLVVDDAVPGLPLHLQPGPVVTAKAEVVGIVAQDLQPGRHVHGHVVVVRRAVERERHTVGKFMFGPALGVQEIDVGPSGPVRAACHIGRHGVPGFAGVSDCAVHEGCRVPGSPARRHHAGHAVVPDPLVTYKAPGIRVGLVEPLPPGREQLLVLSAAALEGNELHQVVPHAQIDDAPRVAVAGHVFVGQDRPIRVIDPPHTVGGEPCLAYDPQCEPVVRAHTKGPAPLVRCPDADSPLVDDHVVWIVGDVLRVAEHRIVVGEEAAVRIPGNVRIIRVDHGDTGIRRGNGPGAGRQHPRRHPHFANRSCILGAMRTERPVAPFGTGQHCGNNGIDLLHIERRVDNRRRRADIPLHDVDKVVGRVA